MPGRQQDYGTMSVDWFVGQQIRFYRLEAGIDAKTLAAKLQVSEGDVLKWETGKERVPAALLFALASILGVTVSMLFCGLEDLS